MTDEKKFEPVERTIAVSSFPYFETISVGGKPQRIRRTARRGQTVTLTEEADVLRGDRNDHFVKPGQQVPDYRKPLTVYDLGLLTDDQLSAMWSEKTPKVDEVLDAVGDNPELARRVLTVEEASDSPRKGVVEPLSKLAGGAA